ncbi:hypothetical protein HRbin01_01602 [archaeon HR01]|nr:hypothetical protein HRbin01_01602 [archaeon HR01]
MSVEEGFLSVVELKHYAYCPRIVYITHVLHLDEAVSEAMEMGSLEHDVRVITPLIARLKAVKVIRDVYFVSERLRVAGRLDYLLVTRFGEYVPVEVKWAESEWVGVKWDHKLQLTAYAVLVEENLGRAVKEGYVYYLRNRRLLRLVFNEGVRRVLEEALDRIHEIVENEVDPGVRVPLSRCFSCGFRMFCRPGLRVSGGVYKLRASSKGPVKGKR